MSMKNQNCIELEKVSFSYDSSLVFKDISFAIEEGEYLGIVGPNGGGKTTLIKIILGLLKTSSGLVKIMGIEGRYFRERYLIGYVP